MHNKSPRNIVGQGDCPRVVGIKPGPLPSGQSRKLPHIRIQLKESKKIQKSIRDVLVPRSHYKANTEGTVHVRVSDRFVTETFRATKKKSVTGNCRSPKGAFANPIWDRSPERGAGKKKRSN